MRMPQTGQRWNVFGELHDRRLWRMQGRERVAAVGYRRARFAGRRLCRAPQQEAAYVGGRE